MAPKVSKNQPPATDPQGIFAGMVVFLITNGVQTRRLQIWKQKLVQMGATIEGTISKRVTHVFTMNSDSLLQQLGGLPRFKGNVLLYQWLEDSLRIGDKVCEDSYVVKYNPGVDSPINSSEEFCPKPANGNKSSGYEPSHYKRIRKSPEDHGNSNVKNKDWIFNKAAFQVSNTNSSFDDFPHSTSPPIDNSIIADTQNNTVATSDSSLPYSPPDLNRNLTEIFGKLINIYRALGDDRRSFSYSKANSVIEKLPFKIESVEQVKHLPAIGKSMQDHIQEIVTTGMLSKLEHFEADEKVRTISMFGEVWGIGPATALKLYDKGYRTLDDLKNEDSLTNAQRLGLKYFDDIKTRISRHEVQEMALLLQKAGEDVLPGVVVVCGGSFRRGKASCGDMDIIITHPDGKSHIGFLSKYVKHLKETAFLREDLIFSIQSEEGTDLGVDTYFGLCTYPGRELRHRIDLKVYPMDIYVFGLIHWTGNDVLNRRLRLLADSRGFRLDDTGLFPATQSSSGNRGVRATKSLRFETEKEVFDFLGFPWLQPNERNL